MAVDRWWLRRARGLRFHRLLGTGHGRSFQATDADPRTWALLTAWDSPADSLAFEGHATPRGWRRIAEQEWRGDLRVLRARGRWAGREPFAPDPALVGWDGPVAAITRATIRPSHWPTFWRAVPPVVADLATAEGPTVRLGIGEAPVGVQGTFSIWPSAAALTDFAYRRAPHRAVIRQTDDTEWYAEDLFARLAVVAERGTLFGEARTTQEQQ